VESDARYQNWGLYARLLEASRWYMRTALAAWLVFRDSLVHHQTGSVFSRLREYFRRHWVKPARRVRRRVRVAER
jgi:hypothetical protein